MNVTGNQFGCGIVASCQTFVGNQFGGVILSIQKCGNSQNMSVSTNKNIVAVIIQLNNHRAYLLWLFLYIIVIAVVYKLAGHHSLRKIRPRIVCVLNLTPIPSHKNHNSRLEFDTYQDAATFSVPLPNEGLWFRIKRD